MRSDEAGTPGVPIDIDEVIHRDEDAGTPPAIPPDSMEDFEKAIWGEEPAPDSPRIPPANPD